MLINSLLILRFLKILVIKCHITYDLTRLSHQKYDQHDIISQLMKIIIPVVLELNQECKVCGSPAPTHLNYGAIACFSCRAFFRRGRPKNRYFKIQIGSKGMSCLIFTQNLTPSSLTLKFKFVLSPQVQLYIFAIDF